MAPPTGKVDASAKPLPVPVPVDAKPADAKPADAKPADVKPADAKPEGEVKVSTGFFSDTLPQIGHLQLDGFYGYSGGTGLSNAEVDPSYKGHGGGFGISFLHDFNPRFSLGAGFMGDWRRMGMSTSGVDATLNKSTWGLGPVANFDAIPRWLRLSTGLFFGQTGINSGDETTDGVAGGGAFYGKNPIKYNVDDKAFGLQWRLCAGVPEIVRTEYFAMGADLCYKMDHSKHELIPDALDRSPSDPAIPVDATSHGVTFGLTFRLGKNAEQSRYFAERANPAPEAKPEGVIPPPAGEKPAPAVPPVVVPAGTKPEVKAAAEKAAEASRDVETSLGKKHGETIATIASGIDPKASKKEQKEEAYSRAQDAMIEYKASKSEYEAAAAKVAELEKSMGAEPLKSMKDEEKKPALEGLAKAKADLEKLKASVEANKAATLQAVEGFYKIKGLSAEQNKWAAAAKAELGVKKK